MQTILSLCRCLKNKKVVSFVSETFKESYTQYFTDNKEEVVKMVSDAFRILCESQNNGNNIEKLIRATEYCNQKIFKKADPYFWFNQQYKEYKMSVRPQRDYEKIKTYLFGTDILDFGSGTGYFGLELEKKDFKVTTVDILDYRIKETQDLIFKRMRSPTRLPFPDRSFDTVLAVTVLHHIEPQYLPSILKELRRVAFRLIIEEDIYAIPKNIPGLDEKISQQARLAKFIKLKKREQFETLMISDYFSNTIAHGIIDLQFPFQFKTYLQWKKTLKQYNFTLNKILIDGFESWKLTQNCQAWIICD